MCLYIYCTQVAPLKVCPDICSLTRGRCAAAPLPHHLLRGTHHVLGLPLFDVLLLFLLLGKRLRWQLVSGKVEDDCAFCLPAEMLLAVWQSGIHVTSTYIYVEVCYNPHQRQPQGQPQAKHGPSMSQP
jgi:hypothetical protein